MQIPEFIHRAAVAADGWVSYEDVQRWYRLCIRDGYSPRRAFELAYERALIDAQEEHSHEQHHE